MNTFHQPVLTSQVIKGLAVKKSSQYIDATIGGGGHAKKILENGGRVLGLDHDPEAVDEAKKNLKFFPDLILETANFINLEEIATKHKFINVAGILADLGASTHQLVSKTRGFSFRSQAPLDMRMDPNLAVTAQDLINGLGRKEMYELFTKYAQEKRSRAIISAIISARKLNPIKTCQQLADLVAKVYLKGGRKQYTKLHPATKVFQALRIAVNDELNNLKSFLPQAVNLLAQDSRLLIISFHQGEDAIVKKFIKNNPELKNITKKPITASNQEILSNPNARSAKLRIAAKL